MLSGQCVSLRADLHKPLRQLSSISMLTQLTSLTLDSDVESNQRLPEGLTALSRLRQIRLTHIPAPAFLSAFPHLVDVHLSPSTDEAAKVDLQQCTAMTCLQVTGTPDPETSVVILPSGKHVSLQHLSLQADCTIDHLLSASNLTYLELSPKSMQTVCWPAYLPSLQSLTVHIRVLDFGERTDRLTELPYEWQNYIGITQLIIPSYYAADLPPWFSCLQDLKVLRMPEARLPSFPTSLLQLARLESLDLANMHSLLTVDVVGLASLPCLTYLNFDFNDDNDSRMNTIDGHACEEWSNSSIEESRSLYLNRLLQALEHRQQQLTPVDVTKHNSWIFTVPG
ncbi:TPA: hypothetical protein ACH3X2_004648 [Trebouxia sp. C0005]